MKAASILGDINAATECFTLASREDYREYFTQISHLLPQLAEKMGPIELVYFKDNSAKYRTRRIKQVNGVQTEVTYFIYFDLDLDGHYRISRF